MPQRNKYVIIREDLVQEPVTIISDGLLIGRLQECELLLNHPAVSRAQAGIKLVGENYFLFGLRPSNPVKLNGRAIEENEALAPGDVLEIGPFLIEVDLSDDALVLKISLQIGTVVETSNLSSPNLGTAKLEAPPPPGEKKAHAKTRAAPLPGDKALDIFWDKRIREAGKMVRHSPLFPRGQRRAGKAAFNWIPTTDLKSRWPVSIFVWSAIAIGVMALAGAYWYANAYAPGPVSAAHTRSELKLTPPIAVRPNANSCTSCHSFSGNMDEKCAFCHHAQAFEATVIAPHAAAGIGCVSCHSEHRGAEFNAISAAIVGCAECHNDANRQLYNGKRVGTPHGGTFGYPVTNEKWNWKGFDDAEWSAKHIAITRLATDDEQKWRSKQFHSLHMQRVKASGLPGDAEGNLSCSSCHKSFNPIDRETPRQTCARCHNGRTDSPFGTAVSADQPNCISCHTQHPKDARKWGSPLLALNQ